MSGVLERNTLITDLLPEEGSLLSVELQQHYREFKRQMPEMLLMYLLLLGWMCEAQDAAASGAVATLQCRWSPTNLWLEQLTTELPRWDEARAADVQTTSTFVADLPYITSKVLSAMRSITLKWVLSKHNSDDKNLFVVCALSSAVGPEIKFADWYESRWGNSQLVDICLMLYVCGVCREQIQADLPALWAQRQQTQKSEPGDVIQELFLEVMHEEEKIQDKKQVRVEGQGVSSVMLLVPCWMVVLLVVSNFVLHQQTHEVCTLLSHVAYALCVCVCVCIMLDCIGA